MKEYKLVQISPEARDKENTFILKEGESLFGRDASCAFHIKDPNISRRHAKFNLNISSNTLSVEDLKSSNGIYVNSNKVEKTTLRRGDIITLGPYRFRFEEDLMGEPSKVEEDSSSSVIDEVDEVIAFKIKLHEELIQKMDLKRMEMEDDPEKLKEMTQSSIHDLLVEKKSSIPTDTSLENLERELLDEILGLGPLEALLSDPRVTEIMVNHKDQIYIERDGKLQLSPKRFISEAQIKGVIERIVAPLGRRIDESSPMVDARLKDGSRVNAIIPPLALKGSSITIRKFSKKPFTIQNLINFNTLTEPMARFLELAVESRQNIVISGGTGSGKTTLLNVVSSFIPMDERIVTVEDAAELQLPQEHVVSLETRPPNIEGEGAITIRDLVRNCLRMRPDRIVVGECRGAEALDMLQAMNTGHDGSLTTGHSNSPRDMLARLETMVLMAGMDLPVRAIREQIASAVQIIVQQSRFSDGSRKITHITEVTGMEEAVVTMQDIFVFKQTGFDENGKIVGSYQATGCVPVFIEKMRERGLKVPMELFNEGDI